jgi:hypothetical protein
MKVIHLKKNPAPLLIILMLSDYEENSAKQLLHVAITVTIHFKSYKAGSREYYQQKMLLDEGAFFINNYLIRNQKIYRRPNCICQRDKRSGLAVKVSFREGSNW